MIWHVLNTVLGLYGRKYSKEWDHILNNIIDYGFISDIGKYTLKFTYKGFEYTIWISNSYYAYGHLYEKDGQYVMIENQFRPKYKTMKRLDKIVKEHIDTQANTQAKNQFEEIYK